ncbi:hypothetical protein V1512DRAFT_225579 [Lipomyces arxii]|uniref:uncharacterized protein n=1 Tax=Lipomyces arxii TaxID=56418 RepID=UPI0034CDEAC2
MSSKGLLDILQGKPVPFQDPAIASATVAKPAAAAPAANAVNVNLLLRNGTTSKTPADKQTPPEKAKPRFTYVNPFFELEAASPLNKTNTIAPARPATPRSATVVKTPLDPAIASVGQATPKQSPTPEPVQITPEVTSVVEPLEVTEAETTVKAVATPEAKPTPDATIDNSVAGYRLPSSDRSLLTISTLPVTKSMSPDACDKIANFKRDFNNFDRNVIAVNDDYIAYPVGNGVRILSQEDGSFTVLVGHEENRIVSILFGSQKSSTNTSLLASVTASNEVIVWEILTKTFSPQFRNQYRKLLRIEKLPPNSEHVPKSRISFPDIQDCVAVSMSRSIYMFPLKLDNFLDMRRVTLPDRVGQNAIMVETETGSRDFAFSPDGTLLATVNKAGCVTLYNIAKLPKLGHGADEATIKHSLTSFTPRAGLRYTSIHFIDSPETVNAGKPLRYLLLGYDQNHSFILWDLLKNDIAQELRFPGEQDRVNGLQISLTRGLVVLCVPSANLILFLHLTFPPIDDTMSTQAELAKQIGTVATTDSASAKFSALATESFFPDRVILGFTLLEMTATEDALVDLYISFDQGAVICPISAAEIGYGVSADARPVLEGVSTGPIETAATEAATPEPQARSVKKHSIVPFGAMKAKMGRVPVKRSVTATPTQETPVASPGPTSSTPVPAVSTPSPAGTPAPAQVAEPVVEPVSDAKQTEDESSKKRGAEDISSMSETNDMKPFEKRQELDELSKEVKPKDKSKDVKPREIKKKQPTKIEAKTEAKTEVKEEENAISVPTSNFIFRPVTAAKRKAILTRENADALGMSATSASNGASAVVSIPASKLGAAEEESKAISGSEMDTKPESIIEKRKSRNGVAMVKTGKVSEPVAEISKITENMSKTIETSVSAELGNDKDVGEIVRKAVSEAVGQATKQLLVEMKSAIEEAVANATASQNKKLDELVDLVELLKKRDRKIEVLSDAVKSLL